MNNFILISKDNNISINLLKEFFNGLFKNYTIEENNNLYIIKHNSNDFDLIYDAINSFLCDTYSNTKVYLSKSSLSDYINLEIEEVSKYFNSNLINSIYTIKDLLLELNCYNESFKKIVLKKYYQNYSMYNTLKVFFLNNMNTLKSSKELFIHRNTLINQIQKFYETTSFDPKEFRDAYMLYSLIK